MRFGGIDDGIEVAAADSSQGADREASTRHLVGLQLSLPPLRRELGDVRPRGALNCGVSLRPLFNDLTRRSWVPSPLRQGGAGARRRSDCRGGSHHRCGIRWAALADPNWPTRALQPKKGSGVGRLAAPAPTVARAMAGRTCLNRGQVAWVESRIRLISFWAITVGESGPSGWYQV